MGFLSAIRKKFFSGAYDASKGSTRRGSASPSRKSEDQELNPQERRQLIANSRDSARNMSLAGWVIRKHLSFVARYRIQFRTGDDNLDKRLAELWQWWSRRKNCDIAERHSFETIIELIERSAVVDGDCALLKLNNGRVQLIEGDRIADPKGADLPAGVKVDNITHGIELDSFGRAKRYFIHRRTKRGALEFQKSVLARNVEFYGYFDRADQVRGITRMASVLSYLRDLRELFEYQLAANKFTSLFGIKFTRTADPADPGGFAEEDVSGDDSGHFEFDVRGGPMKIELQPGEDAEAFESKNPSREFQEFAVAIIQLTLLALDIPMTFFDSRRSSFSAGRQDMAQYMETVLTKRRRLHEIVNSIVAWQVARWVASDAIDLELPEGMQARDVKWDIIATGVIWVDQLKEVSADALAVASGFKSRQQVCMQQGRDFFDVAAQLSTEEKLITELGITVAIGQPGQATTRDEEGAENAANIDDPEAVATAPKDETKTDAEIISDAE